MPIQPSDLLRLSRQLADLGAGVDECVKRCIVSRAYYAALHSVDAAFPAVNSHGRVDGESSHAEIIGRAVACGNRVAPGRTSARTIANMMPRLRRFRNAADYKLDRELDEREYLDLLDRVERILSLCRAYEVEQLKQASSVTDYPDVRVSAYEPTASTDTRHARPALKRVK